MHQQTVQIQTWTKGSKRPPYIMVKIPQSILDSEIQEMAESIANDPTLIKKRIDTVNRLGVVGERKIIAMNFAALDSRLLLEDRSGSNALAIKIAGHYGAGKSHTLTKCLELYPAI